jgi:uncharacterized protein YggT (Ycf19 family)
MTRIPRILNDFIMIVLGIVELFLGLRFVLRLFGANPAAPFAQFVYASSAPLLEPFRNIFPVAVIEPGSAMEFSTLFAMIVYALFAYLVIELVAWAGRAGREA